jgi:hypothetical protein
MISFRIHRNDDAVKGKNNTKYTSVKKQISETTYTDGKTNNSVLYKEQANYNISELLKDFNNKYSYLITEICQIRKDVNNNDIFKNNIYLLFEENNCKMDNIVKELEETVNIINNSIKEEIYEIREYIRNIKDETLDVYNKSVNDIKLTSTNNIISNLKNVNSIKEEIYEIREYIRNIKDETLDVYNKSVNDIKLTSKNNMISYVKDVNSMMNDTIKTVSTILINTEM